MPPATVPLELRRTKDAAIDRTAQDQLDQTGRRLRQTGPRRQQAIVSSFMGRGLDAALMYWTSILLLGRVTWR
jgi:hypothetical protein